MKNYLTAVIALTGLLSCQQASSHVVFTDQLAMAGSYYKGTLRVGHGCGDEPTTSITVKIPAGFEGAKPQPKYGWTLTIKKGRYQSHTQATVKTSQMMWWKSNGKPPAKTFICQMNSLMSFRSSYVCLLSQARIGSASDKSAQKASIIGQKCRHPVPRLKA